MKSKALNTANTIGRIEFGDDDEITLVGTYAKEYLVEALLHITYKHITIGFYTSPIDDENRCLLLTDGLANIGIAPRISHDNPEFVTMTEEQQHTLDMIEHGEGPWASIKFRQSAFDRLTEILEED